MSTTLIMGILAANTCDHDQCSSSLRGLVGGSVGFFAAHTVAIIPTIQRRNTIIRETQEFKATIDEYVNQLETIYPIDTIEFDKVLPIIKQIRSLNDNILNASLPVTKKGDAVNNLITKKILMRNLCDYITHLSSSLANNKSDSHHEILDQAVSFWKQDINVLRDQFRTQQVIEENNISSIGLTQ